MDLPFVSHARETLDCFSIVSQWMKSESVTILMKATDQYLCCTSGVLAFKPVEEILRFYHSNESY